MRTAAQIIAEAPVSRITHTKLAFVCVKCPWWTNDWNKAKQEEGGTLRCDGCGGTLRQLPLEVLIQSTEEENPAHFEGFLKAFSDNCKEDNHG